MTKLIVIAAIAAGAAIFAPQPMSAQSCTQGYEQCLNDTWDTSGFTRLMADIECFAAYVGCVRRTL
jgi:hypothetical protein